MESRIKPPHENDPHLYFLMLSNDLMAIRKRFDVHSMRFRTTFDGFGAIEKYGQGVLAPLDANA